MAFYYLKDKEKIKASLIKKIPEGQRESWLQLGCQIDASMGQFIQGRLLMAVFVGVATAIVLWILGVNYAVVYRSNYLYSGYYSLYRTVAWIFTGSYHCFYSTADESFMGWNCFCLNSMGGK